MRCVAKRIAVTQRHGVRRGLVAVTWQNLSSIRAVPSEISSSIVNHSFHISTRLCDNVWLQRLASLADILQR